MNIKQPEVKEQIERWQSELRSQTNEKVVLVAYDPTEIIPFEIVKHIICKVTGVPFRLAVSKSQKGNIVLTRHFIAYFARKDYKIIHREIAETLERKDHTTIVSSVRYLQNLIDTKDEVVCNVLEEIYKEIEAYKLANY
jgi:chromosomal replication initiation ATPase DnaA